MRQITVDFTSQTYPLFAGYLGEHNATELTAIKPADLDGVTYSLAFMTNGEVIHSEFFGADEEIKVTLWQQLTQDNTLFVQLEAYDENGEYLGKSTMVKLVLSNSVHGMDMIADADNPDVYAEIAQNSAFREMLEDNADTLDKLTTSEDGRQLLFNGRPVQGSGGGASYAEYVGYSNEKIGLGENGSVKDALDIIINNVTDFFAEQYPQLEEKVNNVDKQIEEALEEAKASGEFKGDKGDKGDKGEDGADGKDGNDYILTDADKTEIANAVLDSLAVAEGGLY